VPNYAEPLVPFSAEEYNAFIHGSQLLGIDTTNLHADRLRPGAAPTTSYELESNFSVVDKSLFLRFECTATLKGDDGEPVAHVRVAMVLAFSFVGPEPSVAVVQRFTENVGLMMITPNLREAIHSTALRLGYTGVTLPIMKANLDVAIEPVEANN